MADHACVIVTGYTGAGATALLNQTERELAGRRIRCVRIQGSASGSLAVRNLLAQALGHADAATLTDHDLKAGFLALTEPGEDCELVALLVAEAHSLLPSAVRYIQLACRSSPKLRVLLVGHFGIVTTLGPAEFADLRQVTQVLDLRDLARQGLSDSNPIMPEPALPVSRQRGLSAPARLALAALLIPMVGFIWWRHAPASPAADRAVRLPSVDVTVAQPAATEPVAAERERIEEIFPPELEAELEAEANPATAVAAVDDSPPVSNETPVAPVAELPSVASDTRVAELPAEPVEPAESSTATTDGPSATLEPERAAEASAQDVSPLTEPANSAEAANSDEAEKPAEIAAPVETVQEPASIIAQASEPAAPAPDPAAPPPETFDALGPFASPILPVPPSPRPSRPAVASPPAVQRARAEPPRLVAAAPTPPIRTADQQRCRDIVLKAQLGKDLSDGDKQFLRSGCRAG